MTAKAPAVFSIRTNYSQSTNLSGRRSTWLRVGKHSCRHSAGDRAAPVLPQVGIASEITGEANLAVG
jgi:hypothetical protein